MTTGRDASTLGTSFSALSPLLKQLFVMGDGLTGTGNGMTQEFVVPSGATGRFLGTMDAFGWFDNFGSFDVTVSGAATPPPPSEFAPEPAALILLTSSLAAFHPRGRLSSHDPPGLVN